MDKLRLEIPRQTPNATASALAHPARLKGWLSSLPLGDANKTAQELLTALHQTNRATLMVSQRYAMLEETRPLIIDLLDTLHKQYETAPIPLPEKQEAVANTVRSLLTETAYGYKVVVLELAAAPQPTQEIRNALIGAVHRVIAYLSRLLVESYGIYAPEPKRLWLEVNQLYRYAEQYGFHAVTFVSPNGESKTNSIEQAYRRLLLLALANPYHLMQGETLQVYQELDAWTGLCRLIPMTPGAAVKGQLFIDLDVDAPPRYAPSSFALLPPSDGRIIDISSVLNSVERRVKEVMGQHRTDSGQLSFMGRKLRNMYKRLAEAWGIRSERLAERKRRNAPVDIAVGISACHHFTSGDVKFSPETSEIELRHDGNAGGTPGLSLMGTNDTPWLSEDKSQRLVTGLLQPRTSQFGADKVLNKDVWVKVYSTRAHHEYLHAETQSFESVLCRLLDESQGGLAIECGKGHQLHINVGEVIAFKSDSNRAVHDWSIGTIRWLRTTSKEGLELGIRALAEDASAIAVRGIRGAGKGGEYFRALLIPRLDPTQYPTTLITPAALYDVDSVVLLNTGINLIYARLTRLMDATNAYSLFQFHIIAPPQEDSGATIL